MKLGCFIPNINDGTSFYRGHGVMSELHKIDSSIRVEYYNQADFLKLKGLDVMYMQRPDNPQEVYFAKYIKKMNIPLVTDYDDYLLEVQDYNRYNVIMDLAQVDYKTNVKECLGLSDLVFVSTEELKKQFLQYNKNIEVVRNAFDDYLLKEVKGFNTNKVVMWRGSSTHKINLGMYAPEIIDTIKENQDFKFIFLSDRFYDWQLLAKNTYKNVELIKAVAVYDYFHLLLQIKPSIFYVCLEDSVFNRCKSDVANIEGLGCGAITIAPNWEEWQDTTVYRYETKEQFKDKLRKAINNVKDNTYPEKPKLRLLSEANKKRVELIKELLK